MVRLGIPDVRGWGTAISSTERIAFKAANHQPPVHHPCPGTEVCLGSRLHFQRQPHTAIWNFFLSAGFPDVCLNLTSLHITRRRGRVTLFICPGLWKPQSTMAYASGGLDVHTTPPGNHWSGVHLEVTFTCFLAATPAPAVFLPPSLPFLSLSSFPPPQPPSHPFFAGFCSFFP